jgi:hypothetical protein
MQHLPRYNVDEVHHAVPDDQHCAPLGTPFARSVAIWRWTDGPQKIVDEIEAC